MSKFRNIVEYCRRNGAIGATRETLYQICNYYHGRRLRVNTGPMIRLSDVGIYEPESFDYVPIGYGAIFAMLDRILRDHSCQVFLDC